MAAPSPSEGSQVTTEKQSLVAPSGSSCVLSSAPLTAAVNGKARCAESEAAETEAEAEAEADTSEGLLPTTKTATKPTRPALKARNSRGGSSGGGEALDRAASVPANPDNLVAAVSSASSLSPRVQNTVSQNRSNRISSSSLYSLSSIIHGGNTSAVSSSAASAASVSVPQSPSWDSSAASNGSVFGAGHDPMLAVTSATLATCPISITTSSNPQYPGSQSAKLHQLRPQHQLVLSPTQTVQVPSPASMEPTMAVRAREHGYVSAHSGRESQHVARSQSRTKQRRLSGETNASSHSLGSERSAPASRESSKASGYRRPSVGVIGVCALDVKARSKPSRKILNLLISNGEFEVIVFGDKVILDEAVEDWPECDFLISFFSDGFPLHKAIAYQELRQPFCVNDLAMQQVLWDRRLCLRILDRIGVPTPKRIEVSRDGGPRLQSPELARRVAIKTGVKLQGPEDGTGGGQPIPRVVEMIEDGEALKVDGEVLRKPFVEKPVSGEDHNIRIYFSKANGGGGRRLFRKIGNKSSEMDPNLSIPRAITEPDSSYVYELFLNTNNSEDVKAYTVGKDFCHAETRKSPVVDGLVRRNTHGKEIRYVTELSKEESVMAAKISEAFGQRICGFDLLRVGGKSFVIDINGWSFVKDNDEYYDQCATILRDMFIREKQRRDGSLAIPRASEDMLAEKVTGSASSGARKHAGYRSSLQSILHRSPSFSKPAYQQRPGSRTPGNVSPGDSSASITTVSTSAQHRGSSPHLATINSSSLESLSQSVDPLPLSAADSEIISPPTDERPQTKRNHTHAPKHMWKLKGMVAVIRHADRTPKQKFKFTFHTKPFIDLLRGHDEEVLLIGEAALGSVLEAVSQALKEGVEDHDKLMLLRTSLLKKGGWPGTKVQIKPMFRKKRREELPPEASPPEADIALADGKAEPSMAATTGDPLDTARGDRLTRTSTSTSSVFEGTLSRISAAENGLVLDKLQLVVKWGGEPTHSARYQSQDLGENMRNELLLLNRNILDDVAIYTSSERRVTTSARIWASAFLDQNDIPEDFITIRKDLLDDSNAAKDEMDKVKKKLKSLLRDGKEAPPQFAWPKDNMPYPSVVLQNVVELMRFHQKVMHENFAKLKSGAASSLAALSKGGQSAAKNNGDSTATASGGGLSVAAIQPRWCCQEDAELFRERWEKLFAEFCDNDKVDPSKISELYDTMKFDALHNRQFLEWVFTPSSDASSEGGVEGEDMLGTEGVEQAKHPGAPTATAANASENASERSSTSAASNFAQHIGIHLKSSSPPAPSPPKQYSPEPYFHLTTGSGQTRAKIDRRLGKLRELYRLAKVLFDFICPQEYGIEDGEKLKIGLLTSLPLLQEIVKDLEELQASEQAKSFIYFTKESHIYTLLNCILEGGIQTKIQRNAIPELDYLSQICFELYESENKPPADAAPDEPLTFDYSIRISISPGTHVLDPLDVQLDAKHCIGCVPRRSLTAHSDWKQVIETLRAKFHTVKLPKRFLAVNLSEKVPQDFEDARGATLQTSDDANPASPHTSDDAHSGGAPPST